MKRTMITITATIIATSVAFALICITAGITNGFDYLFEDGACTIASIVIWAIGTWAVHEIYCVAAKIAKKIEEKERSKKMEEYNYIVEMISKKLGL